MDELLEELRGGRGGCLVSEERPGTPVQIPELEVGVQVARLRASSDEQHLSYAGLSELAAPFLDLIDQLPPVQAAALSVEDSAELIARLMEDRYGDRSQPEEQPVA